MSELPDGWSMAPLGELSQWGSGGTPARTNPRYYEGGSIPWLVIGDLNDGYVRRAATSITQLGLDNSSAKLLPPGALLVAMYGSIGKLGISAIECATNQAIAHCLPAQEVVALRYLFHAMQWAKPTLLSLGQGGAQQNISQTVLKSFQIPLAPRPEQTRIADHLDTLLARIKACNDHLDATPGLLKRFRQAVLNAALAGMLDDRDGEAARQIVKVSDIAAVGTGSTPLRSNGSFYASTGTPWVTSAATGAAYIGNADQFVTPAAIAAHRLKVYPKGTLLVAMYGEGKTRGQVSELAIDATINQACAAICVDESLALTSFVKIALAANYLAMRELAEGGNQPNLNLSKIKDFEIPLPSIEEQAAVVKRVNELLGKADRIEAMYSSARLQANQLAPQVLATAFRGHLLPQDANDEPASQLLQRIAAAQAAPAKMASGGKTRGRKKSAAPAVQPITQPALPSWVDLPAGAWSDNGAPHDEHLVTVLITAVLKARRQPMPQEQARLAALLCLQPRLFTAALPAEHAAQWRRLVGQPAEPLPAQVASLQPALNAPWRRALAGLRGRGDLLESGQGALVTWSLGPEAIRVDTSGWPDGRAAWVLAYLQAHGTDSVLPTLAPHMQDLVHARAA